jgi:hypothetical protein
MAWVKFAGGLFIAITAGVVLNLGSLLQKKAVNQMLAVKKRTIQADIDKDLQTQITVKDLLFSRLWVFGFLLQAVIGAVLFIIAQSMIGPSLTPALGSIGLVVLVFAGCIVNEKLTIDEYIGLVIMGGAVALLALSRMTINVDSTDFLNHAFMIRVAIYTGGTIALCALCKIWSWRRDRFEGPVLATLAGLLVALQNYWIAPFTALMTGIFHREGNYTFDHHKAGFAVLYFLVSMLFVIVANLQTVYERQLAFRVGNAATMIPISHLPSHLSSPILYSFVFYLKAPHDTSIGFMWGGLFLLLICSIIFGKRGAHFMDGAKDEEDPEGEKLLGTTNA